MARFLGRDRGFGLHQSKPEPSPFAVSLFGDRDDLPARTTLSFPLVKKDMLQMGRNKVKIDIGDPCYRYAVTCAINAFRFEQRVNPYHFGDILDMPLELRRSSPGIPWQPMYKTRGDVMDCTAARNSMKWFWHRVKSGEKLHPPDCKVLYRAHLMKDGCPKIRAVYGYPTTVTLAEAQFALPLIEGFKQNVTPMAFGYDMLCGGAYKLRRELLAYKNYGCFDFKNFDKLVSKQLIRAAFEILLGNLDFRAYKGKGIPDTRRILTLWDYLCDYFINTTLRLPNGERWKKTAGVPSGSYFTQMVDSIVNYIVIVYAFLKSHGKIPDYIKVFGDDSVVGCNFPIHKYAISEIVESCGMIVNPSKSIVTQNVDEVEFLGFVIANGFPRRSLDKWMACLYNPEYPDKDWDTFASRALGLFYANHGLEPVFSKICRGIVGLRSFSIEMSRDIRRFLIFMNVDPDKLTPDLPDDMSMFFSLIA